VAAAVVGPGAPASPASVSILPVAGLGKSNGQEDAQNRNRKAAIFAESPAGLAGVRIQPSGRRAIVVERSIGSLELVNLLRKRERPVDPRFVDLPINHCSQDA
jgi:hypothetical protein